MQDERNFLLETLSKFGVDKQLDKLVEECAELIVAIQHYKEGRTHSLDHVCEEMADVVVVIEQFRGIYGEEIDRWIIQKITRLKARMGRLNGG
jgi:NTP pyrophosphatase (non-canonical NTP hydrolase)